MKTAASASDDSGVFSNYCLIWLMSALITPSYISLVGEKFIHLNFRDNTGGITFGDFMDFLSTLSKGTLQEKIYWSFRFYDVNKDGIISRDEMIKVIYSRS